MLFSRKLMASIALLLPICGATQTSFNIIPPGPEATAVFKFSEVPVSLYNGLPSISIPLYDIQLKQLTIPIGLSYHARGVQVDEIASSTGLGWALNYGGIISRQTNDKPDDGATGYLYQDYYEKDVLNDAIEANRMYDDYMQHGIDMVPDYFFYNFCGRSGKFVLKQGDRHAVQQKYSDVHIEPIEGSAGIRGWKIVDEYGNAYYFGQSKDGMRQAANYNHSSINYSFSVLHGLNVLGTSEDRYINAWHLVEIETPFNEHVHFYYDAEYPLIYRKSYDKLEKNVLTSYFSRNESVEHQISSIHFNTGIIEFIRTEDREDLTGARELNQVRLKDPDGKLVKEYEFEYDYTTSPPDGNVLPYLGTVEPASSKRFFLERIIEKGDDGESKPPYIFKYNASVLPNRFSTSQDGWGYYNGHANGPFLSFVDYSGRVVNRQVNVDLSGAGLLEKLTYPTGGGIEFKYEQNVGRVPPMMRTLEFNNMNPVKTTRHHGGFIKHPDRYDTFTGIYTSETVTIGSEIKGLVSYEFSTPHCSGAPDSPPPDPDSLPPYCFYKLSLYSFNTDQEVVLYPPKQKGELGLNPGKYLLKVEPMYQHDPMMVENLFYLKFEWREEKVEYPENDASLTYGPGKRIKKIIYRDDNDELLVREFDYQLPNGGSSGQILGLPNYQFINPVSGLTGLGMLLNIYLPGSPLTRTQGNGIGYSYVTEFKGTREQNVGKVETEFTINSDGFAFDLLPYYIPVDNEWRRGRPLVTKYFGRDGDQYVRKRTVSNAYAFPYASTVDNQFERTPTYFSLPLILFTSGGAPNGIDYTIKRYHIRGGVSDLLSTTDSWVEERNTFEKKTVFFYNYAHHYQSAVTRTGNSDGTSDLTIKTYASDYSDESGFLKSMRDANIKAAPIEVVTMKETSAGTFVTGGTLTTYKATMPAVTDESFLLRTDTPIKASIFKFSNCNLGTIPPTENLGVFSKSDKYRKMMTVNSVNSKGNILKITREGNYELAYIWDCSDEIPIAEVENASDGVIAYTSFESEGHGNWVYSGNTIAAEAPTGRKVYSLATGSIAKPLLNPLLIYRLVFWRSSNAVVNIVTNAGGHFSLISEMPGRPGWTLCEYELSDASSIVLLGSGLIDELRLHPKNASMTTYTYDLLKGISTVTDVNGNTTYYKYDKFSRLKRIIDKDGNILKDFEYKYRH